jgi:hypothetical protein
MAGFAGAGICSDFSVGRQDVNVVGSGVRRWRLGLGDGRIIVRASRLEWFAVAPASVTGRDASRSRAAGGLAGMSHPFVAFCEDFYVNMRLGSQMALPHARETVLHFFELVQRAFPAMTKFRKADNGEMNLEEDRTSNAYRWLSLEARRVSSGHVNPETVADALKLHTRVLEMLPYQLGVSPVEIDYLDVLFGFDLEFKGNHDEVIAESLLGESPLICLLDEGGAKAVDFQPTVTVALSEDCRLQGRIDVVTRTNSYQVRTGDYGDDVISVYLIVRRYWGDRPKGPMEGVFAELASRAEQLAHDHVIPKVLRPIHAAISSRS